MLMLLSADQVGASLALTARWQCEINTQEQRSVWTSINEAKEEGENDFAQCSSYFLLKLCQEKTKKAQTIIYLSWYKFTWFYSLYLFNTKNSLWVDLFFCTYFRFLNFYTHIRTYLLARSQNNALYHPGCVYSCSSDWDDTQCRACDLHGGSDLRLALISDLVSIRRACQGLRGAFHAVIEKLKGSSGEEEGRGWERRRRCSGMGFLDFRGSGPSSCLYN